MAKSIYCSKCGKHLGELEKGSKILKGTKHVCAICFVEEKESFDFASLLSNLNSIGKK